MNTTISNGIRVIGCAACIAAVISADVHAQIASALIREQDPLNGEVVGAINNTAVNHVGGYAVTVNTDGILGTTSHVWGNAGGGSGAIIRSEMTIGDFQQTSFESFFGISDTGQVAYSPSSTRISTGTTSLDGVWKDDAIVWIEEDPVPGMAGTFYSFGSRPGITADGQPYGVGGFTDSVGGLTQNRALFFGDSATVVLQGGDFVGVPEPIVTGGGIDFDFRFSALGTNNIVPVDVDAPSSMDIVITRNGTALTLDGVVVREDNPVPASVGGMGGENYDNFDFMGVTEAGEYLITGDTNGDSATDEFILKNGQMILREGDLVGSSFALDGSIEGAYMNENGDWAAVWDIDDGMGNSLEALLCNGDLFLVEGETVDWNGDGIIDANDMGATVANFSGISTLTLSDRDSNSQVDIYFTADVLLDSGAELEAAFRLSHVIPEPATSLTVCLAVLGLLAVRRRR